MKKIFLIFLVLIIFVSSAFAKPKEDWKALSLDIAQTAAFDTKRLPIVFDLNGVKVTLMGTWPTTWYKREMADNSRIYTNGGHAAAIKGAEFEFENTTDKVVVISWGKSVMSINGVQVGTPFIGGMKYADAGNPSNTPDTIIPPKGKVRVAAYVPFIKFLGRSWIHEGAPLLRDDFLRISYYINITINDTNKYYNLELPGLKATKDYP